MIRKLNIFFIACAILAGCGNREGKPLEDYAKLQNRSCPQPLDSELVLTSYDYDSDANIFTITYKSTETASTIDALRRAEVPLRRIIANNFRSRDLEELSQLLIDSKSTLCMRFIGIVTNDTLCIDFPNSDIEEIVGRQNAADSGNIKK